MSQESKYLKYLPATFREQGEGLQENFMGRFLLAFERALSGIEGETGDTRGIEEVIDEIHNYFDPNRTPPQFINWLAKWVALDLPQTADWMESDFGLTQTGADQTFPFPEGSPLGNTRNRNLIKSIASLYRSRGTRKGLEEFIRVYAPNINIEIREFPDSFRIGETSTIGDNAMIDERPYYFQAVIYVPAPNPQLLAEFKQAAAAILDREKPAHTFYDFVLEIPTLQIGTFSSIGGDTLIGGMLG